MQKKFLFFVIMLLFIWCFSEWSFAEDNLIPVTILRVPQPSVVFAEACCGKNVIKVRIKLAGIKPPLSWAGFTELLRDDIRKLSEKPGMSFGFALGHTQEEKVWVGYLYYNCACEKSDEEITIVNGELIQKGLAEVDLDTAGENMLSYLLSLQQEAKDNQRGIWGIKDVKNNSRKTDECSSCQR
ncbi:MAG: thermonuclease family protein [Candidatus Atribacteria bacterium]|nr:thermonuclease family protein [Candidatus Atribacteria bacterium]